MVPVRRVGGWLSWQERDAESILVVEFRRTDDSHLRRVEHRNSVTLESGLALFDDHHPTGGAPAAELPFDDCGSRHLTSRARLLS